MEATDLLHDGTAAIFVGEPTGGKPSFCFRAGFCASHTSAFGQLLERREHANDPGPTLVPDIRAG